MTGYTRPYLYPKQHDAMFCLERWGITEATTKSGKTVSAMAWLLEEAFKGKVGWNYWWIAPVSSQADIAFTRFKNGLTRGSFTPRERYGQPTLTLANGAIIWFKSADNADSLYGEDVYAAVIDEGSRVKEPSFYAVRSTLTATRGPCRIIGNVKGRKNWFYRMARDAESGAPNMHYAKITAYDAVAAGVLDAEEIEDARRMLPEMVFRELYLAEPSEDGGNPFGLAHIAACIRPALSQKPPVAFGIDLAKKQDYLVIIGLDEDGAVCVFERWQGKPWNDSINEIHRIVGPDTPALVDSTGIGDPVLESLQYEHGNFFGYMFSPMSKQRLMEGLSVSIQSREISYPKGRIQHELEAFEYQYKPSGVRYSAPEGEFDDCVCALALAREQLTTIAPGANIMAFYATQVKAVKAQQEEEREAALPWHSKPLLSRADIIDNELTALYNETLKGYEPEANLCHGCGQPLVGPSRVTDGEFSWHTGCALVKELKRKGANA